MKAPVLKNLKEARYLLVFIGSAFLLFDFSYYLMSTLPGSKDYMCVEGANLTPENIIFSIILSLMVGVMAAGLINLFTIQTAKSKAKLTSIGGIGLGIGSLTMFCSVCTLPILSLFGLSVVFELFLEYSLIFRTISFLMLGTALFLLNKQLLEGCKKCVYEPEKAAE
jgi:hypothetical protein